MANVQIEDNSDEVINRINKSMDLALGLMARAVEGASRPKTPRDRGDLRREVSAKKVKQGQYEVVWNKEYAQAQEAGVINGSKIRNYTTPGTGPGFAEYGIRKVTADAERYLRQAGVFTRG